MCTLLLVIHTANCEAVLAAMHSMEHSFISIKALSLKKLSEPCRVFRGVFLIQSMQPRWNSAVTSACSHTDTDTSSRQLYPDGTCQDTIRGANFDVSQGVDGASVMNLTRDGAQGSLTNIRADGDEAQSAKSSRVHRTLRVVAERKSKEIDKRCEP